MADQIAKHTRNILSAFGVRRVNSMLEYRCGSGIPVEEVDINEYFGVDPRKECIEAAKSRDQTREFYHGSLDYLCQRDRSSNIVACFDIRGAVHSGIAPAHLISVLANCTDSRLIVSAPNGSVAIGNRHSSTATINLPKLIKKTGLFKQILVVGTIGGTDVIVADRSSIPMLGTCNAPNDINNAVLATALAGLDYRDEIFECVAVSRATFGWYTRHFPRLFEYPWILNRLGCNAKGLRIGDFGTGLAPIPISLANRGAEVSTVDAHGTRVKSSAAHRCNEWGFFDYGEVHSGVTSYNSVLSINMFQPETFDAWYSVSVIEHMPSDQRRQTLDILALTLKPDGRLLLTLDLEKGSENLWNKCEGKIVENANTHGTMSDIVDELRSRGFHIVSSYIQSMPMKERVDVGFIEGMLVRNSFVEHAFVKNNIAIPRRGLAWKFKLVAGVKQLAKHVVERMPVPIKRAIRSMTAKP